eukprot:10160520-Alexandrium_andersonii.AAC.1
MAATRRRRPWQSRIVIRELSWRVRFCARGACATMPWTRHWPVSAGPGTIGGSCDNEPALVDLRRAVAERLGAQTVLGSPP